MPQKKQYSRLILPPRLNGSSTRIIIMTVMYFICVTSPLVTFAFTTNVELSAPMRIAAFCAR